MNRLVGFCLMAVWAGLGCARPLGHPGTAPTSTRARARAPSRPQGACQDLPRRPTKVATAKGSDTAVYGRDVVHGRVVLPNGDDARGLAVSIGEQRVLTDGDGGFVLHKVPTTYDLNIADPDRRRVTAYYGLTRRDPILSHTAHDTSKVRARCYQASVSGRLQWDANTAEDLVAKPAVYFLSEAAFAKVESADLLPHHGGSACGPLRLDWLGNSATSGTILALSQGRTNSYLATASVTLANGEARQQDLRLAPIPMGRIAGSLGTRTFYPEHVRAGYALPDSAERIDLGECKVSKSGAFECYVPDLSALGGEYCVSQPLGTARFLANRCGAKLGTKDLLVEPAPWEVRASYSGPPHPQSLSSSDRETLAGDMVSWTATGSRVYQLDIGNCSAGTCAVVYLARTAFSWSEVRALDLKYHPLVVKNIVVSAIHPYKATDQLAAGDDPLGNRATWHRVEDDGLILTMPTFWEDTPPHRPTKELDWADANNLPVCPSTSEVIQVSDLGPATAETRVSVHGILTASACDRDPYDNVRRGRKAEGEENQRCWCQWILEDAARKFRPVEFFQSALRSDDGLHCEPHAPRVDAIVTGVVVPCGGFGFCAVGLPPCPADYCLDDVSLCAVRSAASSSSH